MDYDIRKATLEDLSRIEQIYAFARSFMKEHGNPDQWADHYPPTEMLQEDIRRQLLFVLVTDGEIHGVFYFYIGEDPTYQYIENGTWRSDERYGTIHRIAGDGKGGVLHAAVTYCKTQISHLRIDTHAANTVMQNAILKQGFSERGIVYMEDGSSRIAYDLLIQ